MVSRQGVRTCEVLHPLILEVNTYIIKRAGDFRMLFIHKYYVKSSFSWNVPLEWNKNSTFLIVNQGIFRFSNQSSRDSQIVPVYSQRAKDGAKSKSKRWSNSSTCVRMDLSMLSSLNSQSFRYTYIPNSKCLLWPHRAQDTNQFPLHCPPLVSAMPHL